MKKIKLFCFPFAGGISCYYNKFKSILNEKIVLIPIELPGRGTKFSIPPKTNIKEVIENISHDVISQLDDQPYMFWGHSLGSLIEYELYYKLSENNICLPKHIFFSGCKAPHLIKFREKSYLKSDSELIEVLRKNGGTSEQFFEHQNLLDWFLPILRADYTVIDTYNYIPDREKLKCNITVLKGASDLEGGCSGLDWSTYSQGNFQECIFDGKHFFINQHTNDILQLINNWALSYLKQSSVK